MNSLFPKSGEVPSDDGPLLGEGVIALQSESADIHFRTVELLNFVGCMDELASNFKIYHIIENNDLCQYIDPVRMQPEELGIYIGSDAVRFQQVGSHSLNILNVNGEDVYSRTGSGAVEYNLAGKLKPGVYFIQVKFSGYSYEKKFLVL